MKTPELVRWTAGWRHDSHQRLVGELELQRRRDKATSAQTWIAIALSVISLVVSLVTLFS